LPLVEKKSELTLTKFKANAKSIKMQENNKGVVRRNCGREFQTKYYTDKNAGRLSLTQRNLNIAN